MASLAEQVRLIMESAPKCTARGCPEEATQVVMFGEKPVPYCKTHAQAWADAAAARKIIKWIEEDDGDRGEDYTADGEVIDRGGVSW
jgi:hypothetical protein